MVRITCLQVLLFHGQAMWSRGKAYMQRCDALVIAICGIGLARLKQLFHGSNITYPRKLHDFVFWTDKSSRRNGAISTGLAVGSKTAHFHLVIELRSGGGRLGGKLYWKRTGTRGRSDFAARSGRTTHKTTAMENEGRVLVEKELEDRERRVGGDVVRLENAPGSVVSARCKAHGDRG